MLILFDQGTPAPLIPFLAAHQVITAQRAGWDKVEDGELLTLAEQAGFHVLVTTDQNMIDQQNLEGRQIAVVVLGNPHWGIAQRYVRRIARAVDAAAAGTCTWVEMPFR